jgi:hypothetical protein
MAWSRNRGSAGHSHIEGRLTRGDSAIPRRGELRTAAPSFFHALARPTGRDTAAAHEEPQGQGRGDCRVGCAQSSSGFAGVFERGGREPMEGSLGSAGEEQAPRRSGCGKSGVLDELLERPQSSTPTGRTHPVTGLTS